MKGWFNSGASGHRSDATATRRGVLMGIMGSLTFALQRPVRAVAHACRMLVDADEGPFYPVEPIPETDDLVTPDGKGGANSELVYLTGLVLDRACRPFANATVELWQCDPGGQYRHPRAPVTKDLDPSFRYFARTRTDDTGFYRFRTLRPAPYRVFGLQRAPHFHLRVKAAGYPTLTTEAYFAGDRDDALRARDQVFLGRGPRRAEMIAAFEPATGQRNWLRVSPEPHALALRYDIGLGRPV